MTGQRVLIEKNISSWSRKGVPRIASLHIRKLQENDLSTQFNMKSEAEKGVWLLEFMHFHLLILTINCSYSSLIKTCNLSIMVTFNNSFKALYFKNLSKVTRISFLEAQMLPLEHVQLLR